MAQVTLNVSNGFHTPSSMEALENWVNRHDGLTAMHIWTGIMMYSNYLAVKLNDPDTEFVKSTDEDN